MAEKVFEFDMVAGKRTNSPGECGNDIGVWLWEQADEGKKYRVTVRVEPKPGPERVKWPWPDVNRVTVTEFVDGRRCVQLRGTVTAHISYVDANELGVWPATESRIATRTADGYVELSEVPNE